MNWAAIKECSALWDTQGYGTALVWEDVHSSPAASEEDEVRVRAPPLIEHSGL